jgi:hypothetical protein
VRRFAEKRLRQREGGDPERAAQGVDPGHEGDDPHRLDVLPIAHSGRADALVPRAGEPARVAAHAVADVDEDVGQLARRRVPALRVLGRGRLLALPT